MAAIQPEPGMTNKSSPPRKRRESGGRFSASRIPACKSVIKFQRASAVPFVRRSRESGNLGISVARPWVPACAGTTNLLVRWIS